MRVCGKEGSRERGVACQRPIDNGTGRREEGEGEGREENGMVSLKHWNSDRGGEGRLTSSMLGLAP